MPQKNNSLTKRWKTAAAALKKETYALYLAARHPGTPWGAKIFISLVVASAFSPIDLIPDFIPVLGYLDDLILIPLGVLLVRKMIPTDVLAECQQQSEAFFQDKTRPINWVAGALIILLWIVLTGWLLWWGSQKLIMLQA